MNDQAINRLAVLAIGLRRRLYEFIRQRRSPVTRDEAAAAAGISRRLAAFHLDKLVEAGLLRSHYARLPGRSGPGAGRSSKLYEPSDVELEVSLPQRHYDIPAEILLEALQAARAGEDAQAAAERVAYARGSRLGQELRDGLGMQPHRDASVPAQQLLASCGYEPYRDADGTLRLRNCPFHRLAQRSPEIVCAINRALIDGMLRGVGDTTTVAVLDPRPDQCCVAVRSRHQAA